MPLGNRRTINICFNSLKPFSLTFTACLLSVTWLLRKLPTQFGNWKVNRLFYRHKLPAVVTLHRTMEGVNLQSRPSEKLALDWWLRMGHFPKEKQFMSFNKKPKWMVMLSRRNGRGVIKCCAIRTGKGKRCYLYHLNVPSMMTLDREC